MSIDRPWLANYPAGVAAQIDVGKYASVPAVLEEAFGRFRDKPAFANFGRRLSYGQIDDMSRQFAGYLTGVLKLGKGDRIAIMMPNVMQYPIALFGALRAGLVVVNTNPLYTARELKHQLEDSGAKAIVVLDNFASILQKVVAETSVRHIVTTGLGDLLGVPRGALINFALKHIKKMVPSFSLPQAVRFRDALARGAAHPLPPATMTHDDLAFTRLGGLNGLITNPRDMPGFVKELKASGVTALTGVNTLFNGLLNTPGFADLDFSRLHMSLGGGMAVQRAVAERWKKVTGCTLAEAYGLTETSPAVCINPLDLKEYNGSIGLPVPSTDVAIWSDEGQPLPVGEVGELMVRGPQVMKGYWQRPEETARVLGSDGWLHTGDIARMDENGYFYIVDRKKDMILVSGFNVYPNKIEDVVAQCPGVLEVAAVGIPDEKSCEAVKVVVVRKDPN